jgi:electron transfer flavoprotein beta subunit
MNICVLVKQVPDHEAHVTATGEGAVQIEDKYVTSFFDEVAIEQALLLREAHGGTVTAVAAGGGRQVDGLRRALAMGADDALHVDDPALADADGLGTARALAAALGPLEPDVVLAGRVALDDEMGLVGPAVAELLDVVHVGAIVSLEVHEGRFTAVRAVQGGRETVQGTLPVLVTAQKGLAEPRVPKVMAVMKASRAEVQTRDLAALGLDAAAVAPRVTVTAYSEPPARPPVSMIEGELPEAVETLAELLEKTAGGGS